MFDQNANGLAAVVRGEAVVLARCSSFYSIPFTCQS